MIDVMALAKAAGFSMRSPEVHYQEGEVALGRPLTEKNLLWWEKWKAVSPDVELAADENGYLLVISRQF